MNSRNNMTRKFKDYYKNLLAGNNQLTIDDIIDAATPAIAAAQWNDIGRMIDGTDECSTENILNGYSHTVAIMELNEVIMQVQLIITLSTDLMSKPTKHVPFSIDVFNKCIDKRFSGVIGFAHVKESLGLLYVKTKNNMQTIVQCIMNEWKEFSAHNSDKDAFIRGVFFRIINDDVHPTITLDNIVTLFNKPAESASVNKQSDVNDIENK